MTDDLIKRLRAKKQKGNRFDSLEYEAADHIEQLAATCEELVKERDFILSNQTYSYLGKDLKRWLARDLEDAKDAAEAELAKAVAGLRKIADHKHFVAHQGWTQNAEARIASAVLAELEGQG